MTGNTPLYGWPYPTAPDRLDAAVTTIPQSMALAIESTLAGWGGIAAPAAWEVVGAAGKPAFAANWGAYGSGYQVPAYRKVGQQLFIRGLVLRSSTASGTGSTIFTLPVGYRPTGNLIWSADANGGYAQLSITAATGAVAVFQSIAAGNYVSLTAPPIWLD